MRPQTVGRVLGVGLRVAGRLAGQRLAASAGNSSAASRPVTVAGVGGKIALEVTGVFFLIFVLVFGQMAWRTRSSFAHGADHLKFLLAAALMLVFLYLSVSSFWRARRK